ncbi:MAG: DUF2207 domain-containing protein [Patescibacteria group bacterium]|nr:DUF2207 domain-containing protein [Patescibacteria group bacterium]
MKKIIFFALFAALLIVPNSVFALEIIRDFKVDAELNADRTLQITENITYDFGEVERHGIFRFIPISYVRNKIKYNLRPEVISVTMDGESVSYEATRKQGELMIRIGDPDKTISGSHEYAITYKTDRAINFFSDQSELYWNVTGNQWPVSIMKASFDLSLRDKAGEIIKDVSLRALCFTGYLGSEEKSCGMSATEQGILFETTNSLNAQEGLTAIVGIPLGVIENLTFWDKVLIVLQDNMIFGIPLLAFLIMLGVWFKRGRDPELGTVIPLYESPDKLKPAELAAVVDQGTVSDRAITATIINLAKRGYLSIGYDPFAFHKKKDADSSFDEAEKLLFEGLFKKGDEVKLKDLQKQKFYMVTTKAKEAVWESMLGKQVFDKRPATVRALFFGLAIISTFAMFIVLSTHPFGFVVAIVTGVIIAIFAWFMPKRTVSGVDLLGKIKGFEWFMSVTEKERLEFHNAPSRTPEQFQELLPYAIALGVEKQWARQFDSISMEPPSWAEGTAWRGMNSVALVSGLNSMHMAASSGYQTPSSTAGGGGSGFSGGGSGGGFGGGGGGSW